MWKFTWFLVLEVWLCFVVDLRFEWSDIDLIKCLMKLEWYFEKD